jgi:hypothetical protein
MRKLHVEAILDPPQHLTDAPLGPRAVLDEITLIHVRSQSKCVTA